MARIKLGLADELRLGNLDAERDWGFAGDYVRAMWLMLQQEEPGDYVIATGKAAFGAGVVDSAFAPCRARSREHVVIDPKFLRPAEVDQLIGDAVEGAGGAGVGAGRCPSRSSSQMMVDADLERLSGDAGPPHRPAVVL